jgi:hypothetical protein
VRRKLSVNHCAKNMNMTLVSVEGWKLFRRNRSTTAAGSGSVDWSSLGGRCRPVQVRSVRPRHVVYEPCIVSGRGRGRAAVA